MNIFVDMQPRGDVVERQPLHSTDFSGRHALHQAWKMCVNICTFKALYVF